MGDLEQMFYQIYVPEKQRSLLRFLWWPDGDLNQELEEMEMCVHLFGAVSSPSVAGLGLSIERAVGVVWNVESDTLGFRIQFSDKNLSRRTILSDVSSIYDPDGRGCAFVFPGKKILQEITGQKKDWDAALSPEHVERWNKWKLDVISIENLIQPRCFTPVGFGKPVKQTLHCFSDGSTIGYGVVSYIRRTNAAGDIHVTLVTGKSRVAPLKSVTIPRLELTAAALSAKVGAMVQKELDIPDLEVVYWTDSTITLGYINNQTTRYKTFVRNKINVIHQYSDMAA